jgi:site-specific recombinase XerD
MPDVNNFWSHDVSPECLTEATILLRIAGFTDLRPSRRAELASAVRTAMRILRTVNPGASAPPAFSCEALNAGLWRRESSCFGISSRDAFNNLVSRCRTVLVRLDLHEPTKCPLSPAWQTLYDSIEKPERCRGLIGLLRYLSSHGIAPDAVEPATLDQFERVCTTRVLHKDVGGFVRRTAGNWAWARTNVPGWPQVELIRIGMRDQYGLPFSAYPASFAAETETFLANLAKASGGAAARRVFTSGAPARRGRAKGARPRTVKTRRDHIRVAAGALVRLGTPAEAITGLHDLVRPADRPGAIADFLYERHERWADNKRHQARPAHMLGVIETLRQVAKFFCHLPDGEVAEIAALAEAYDIPKLNGMTDANLARVRRLLEEDTYAMLLHLPSHLLTEADEQLHKARKTDPGAPPSKEAARQVRLAVAVEILLNCPMRRTNLVNLHDHQLLRDRTGTRIARLSIEGSTTKTGQMIDLEVPDSLARLLDVWLRRYRPVLAHPDNLYLFPGEGVKPMNMDQFGTTVSEEVEAEIGAEFNLHVARHFAVVRFLTTHPGQYGVVCRLLGHTKVETTMKFYAGLEADAAARMVNLQLQDDRARTRIHAIAARRQRRGRGGKRKDG